MIDFKYYLDQISEEDDENKLRIREDQELYYIYNGKLREQILAMIRKEFVEEQTVTELQNRIIPINIIKKIIDKLAMVYRTEPMRKPEIEDISDQESITYYENIFDINSIMEFSNKMYKLQKHCLLSPYLNIEAYPKIRCLPSHTFSLFSSNKINPEIMDVVIMHIKTDGDKNEQRYEYWDKDNYWIFDGNAEVVMGEMIAINNQQGKNPYGVLPFIHITQQTELLYPIRSSDMRSIEYAICLLLSDTTLAQKYLSWGTLVTIGANGAAKLKIGPGAHINLPIEPGSTQQPDIKYLQPNLNSTEVLEFVAKLIELLLTTNNLSAAQMTGNLQVGASGISKMLDQVESTEDIESQQKYFAKAEKELWDLFSQHMLPYWQQKGIINKECTFKFSPEFKLSVIFPERKPMLTEKEKIENIKAKLDTGFITMKRAMAELYPQYSDEEIDDLILEIQNEKLDNMKFFERNMGEQVGGQESNGQFNGASEQSGE